jgi:hypothetical protein
MNYLPKSPQVGGVLEVLREKVKVILDIYSNAKGIQFA